MKAQDVALGFVTGRDHLSPRAAVNVLGTGGPVLAQPVRVRELGLLGILLCVRHRRERHKRGDQCATLWVCDHGRPLWGVLNVISNESPGVSTFSNQISPFTPAEHWRVSNFVRQFVQTLQRSADPPDNERHSSLEIGTGPTPWKRTNW